MKNSKRLHVCMYTHTESHTHTFFFPMEYPSIWVEQVNKCVKNIYTLILC